MLKINSAHFFTALVVHGSKLTPERRPVPEPTRGQILIKVVAAGVNRSDLLQYKGLYSPPLSPPENFDSSNILGLEVSGYIVGLGDDETEFCLGDPVMALLTGGGYAEYALANSECCLPIPHSMDLVAAAAFPETFFTVWLNVFKMAQLKTGESLLIHGGSSGIGTCAIQLAKAHGAQIFITAGTDEKCRFCLELGADVAINYRTEDFVQVIKNYTFGHGIDVILDCVGGSYVPRNYEISAMGARILQIAFLNGAKTTVSLPILMKKRLLHTGSMLRSQSLATKKKIALDLRKYIFPLLQTNKVAPKVTKTFPFLLASDALSFLEKGDTMGKIVLKMAQNL